jgi:hypothetical protein
MSNRLNGCSKLVVMGSRGHAHMTDDSLILSDVNRRDAPGSSLMGKLSRVVQIRTCISACLSIRPSINGFRSRYVGCRLQYSSQAVCGCRIFIPLNAMGLKSVDGIFTNVCVSQCSTSYEYAVLQLLLTWRMSY